MGLARDPQNKFSQNAVKVIIGTGHCVGDVPEVDAVELAPLLDSGHKQKASITKLLNGREISFPSSWPKSFR